MAKKTICLISSQHVSYNPRLLKEADALSEAGNAVRVAAVNLEPVKAAWDRKLMINRAWRLDTVNACRSAGLGQAAWLHAALRQRLHQRAAWLQRRNFGVEKAYSRHFPELARLAARERADLFIAHNLQALPAAAFAARRWRARLGFDAEDFHRGEIAENDPRQASMRRLTEAVEEKYIPRCDYLSAASDGIGEAYAEVLRVPKPITILNVYPLSERQGHTPPEELQRERQGNGPSLYWYSQVIGGDRGLGDVLQAMSLLSSGVQLHVRGAWANGFEQTFRRKIQDLRLETAVHVLPCVPPEQLVERAAQHDVGLALETGETQNRRVAVTNKLLNYFLAGLAIAATDVPGQRGIMHSAPGAGFLYEPGDAEKLAHLLWPWAEDGVNLRAAREKSRDYGRSRFCWDIEKAKLLTVVEHCLSTADSGLSRSCQRIQTT